MLLLSSSSWLDLGNRSVTAPPCCECPLSLIFPPASIVIVASFSTVRITRSPCAQIGKTYCYIASCCLSYCIPVTPHDYVLARVLICSIMNTAASRKVVQRNRTRQCRMVLWVMGGVMLGVATRGYALLRVATRCYALLRVATRCYALLRVATRCYALLRVATRCYAWLRVATRGYAFLRVLTRSYGWLRVATKPYATMPNGIMGNGRRNARRCYAWLRLATSSYA